MRTPTYKHYVRAFDPGHRADLAALLAKAFQLDESQSYAVTAVVADVFLRMINDKHLAKLSPDERAFVTKCRDMYAAYLQGAIEAEMAELAAELGV